VARITHDTHGTTGFLATLVLTCIFAIVASAPWIPRRDSGIAVATDVLAPTTGATVAPAAAVR
jgi:hypothetical protein